jgi:hypothetical protein
VTTTTWRGSAVRRIAVVLTVLALVGACGDDGSTDATGADEDATTGTDETTSDDEATTTTTVDAAADEAAIGAVLTEFFALVGQGDFGEAVQRLENGDEHEAKLVHCADLVEGISIEMISVELIDEDRASALFSIVRDGEVLLAESGGGATRAEAGWLVSENTFLSLYDAAKEGCMGTPPPEG